MLDHRSRDDWLQTVWLILCVRLLRSYCAGIVWALFEMLARQA